MGVSVAVLLSGSGWPPRTPISSSVAPASAQSSRGLGPKRQLPVSETGRSRHATLAAPQRCTRRGARHAYNALPELSTPKRVFFTRSAKRLVSARLCARTSTAALRAESMLAVLVRALRPSRSRTSRSASRSLASSLSLSLCIYIYIYMCVYIYIYIYKTNIHYISFHIIHSTMLYTLYAVASVRG